MTSADGESHSTLDVQPTCSAEHPPLTMLELNFEDFKIYLRVARNKNKDTTEAISQDVKNYLDNNRTSEPDNPELYYWAKREIDEIDEWWHGLRKQITVQRQEYSLVLRKELPDPNEFMEQDKVHNQI